MNRLILIGSVVILMMSSCVSTKKYKTQVAKYDSLKTQYDNVDLMLSACISDKEKQSARVISLEDELANLKANSNTMMKQLGDMSVISSTQAESIRKSLENINSKDSYIKNLQVEMSRKDSLNMALVLNLKGALANIDDKDVDIKVEGSAVFISISDKMLFKSGSYEITAGAKEVLGKVASVVNAQPTIQFMVEGHTDNKAISSGAIKDNWDLSVLRSTAIVRVLQKTYKVDPARMIAAGRSEYISVASNDNAEGRASNRRTRIVILPQLDQFFKLMEPKN